MHMQLSSANRACWQFIIYVLRRSYRFDVNFREADFAHEYRHISQYDFYVIGAGHDWRWPRRFSERLRRNSDRLRWNCRSFSSLFFLSLIFSLETSSRRDYRRRCGKLALRLRRWRDHEITGSVPIATGWRSVTLQDRIFPDQDLEVSSSKVAKTRWDAISGHDVHIDRRRSTAPIVLLLRPKYTTRHVSAKRYALPHAEWR